MGKFFSQKIPPYLVKIIGLLIIVVSLFNQNDLNNIKPIPSPKKVEATYQYAPTGGAIITGSNPAILGATVAATEGVNMGDWRGALADDNLHFGITSTTGGFNAYLDLANVELNNANTIIIQTEFDLDATAPSTLVQICDWVSTTGVNNAADAQCTGGGWRNLNLNDTTLTTVTPTAYAWHIYNGYWNTSATAPIDTPLSNFLGNGSNSIRIRYFSTTNTTSLVNVDYLRVHAVINPIYAASGATQITGGTPLGDYSLATYGGAGQTGSDNVYFRVPGTAGAISDFYMSFDDIRTYTGANAILYRAEYSCSTTGINIRPKIYNFNTASWEDLAAAVACSATDATNAWAKNNVTISDYISNGEVRIGWYGSANNVLEIRVDMAYIMIGTTNTDGVSEISFGSNSAGTVTNTRTLDMTGTASTWNILSADESNTQGFASYGNDGDNDATVEEATAANMKFDVTVPINTVATGVFFASRHMSGAAGTVQPGIYDYSGLTGTMGGWTSVGAGGTTALTYSDNITVASVASGGSAGYNTNPEDYFDTVNNKMNVRLRTTASGATTNNSVAQWDFAMVSLQWVEVPFIQTLTFSISDNTVGLGALSSTVSRYATGDTLGSNTSSVIAHTISVNTNAIDGYVMTLNGTTLTSGANTVTAIGSTALSPTTESEQFGVNGSVASGNGVVSAPYATASQYAFDTGAFPDRIATGAGDSITTVYNLRYVANISSVTEYGTYSSGVTYVVTSSF